MTTEFGLKPGQDFKEIEHNFDLIMIYEQWNVSLVLLKNLLKFEVSDMVNLRMLGKGKMSAKVEIQTENRLKQYLWKDYQLYNHFLAKFEEQKSRLSTEELKKGAEMIKSEQSKTVGRCGITPNLNKDLNGKNRHSFGSNDMIGYKVKNQDMMCQSFGFIEKAFVDLFREKQEVCLN